MPMGQGGVRLLREAHATRGAAYPSNLDGLRALHFTYFAVLARRSRRVEIRPLVQMKVTRMPHRIHAAVQWGEKKSKGVYSTWPGVGVAHLQRPGSSGP